MYETLHFKMSYQHYRKSGKCNILHKNSSDLSGKAVKVQKTKEKSNNRDKEERAER